MFEMSGLSGTENCFWRDPLCFSTVLKWLLLNASVGVLKGVFDYGLSFLSEKVRIVTW